MPIAFVFISTLLSCASTVKESKAPSMPTSEPAAAPRVTLPDEVTRAERWDDGLQVAFLQRNGETWRDEEGRRCTNGAVSQWLAEVAELDLLPASGLEQGNDVVLNGTVAIQGPLPSFPTCSPSRALGITDHTQSVTLTFADREIRATQGDGGWVDASGQSVAPIIEAIAAWALLPRIEAQAVDREPPWGTIVVAQPTATDTFELGPPASHGPDYRVLHRESMTVFRFARDAVEALAGAPKADVKPMTFLGGARCADQLDPERRRETPVFERWLMVLDGGTLISQGCGQTHPMIGQTQMKLRWESAGGVAVISDAGSTAYDHPNVEALPPGELVWTVSKGGEPYAGGAFFRRYRFAWDPTSHQFLEAAPVEELHGMEWHEARIAEAVQREDWTLAVADAMLAIDFNIDDRLGSLAKLLHPRVIALHRAGRDREAADLVLAALTVKEGEFQPKVAEVLPERLQWILQAGRGLASSTNFAEILNDFGFVLDEAGESTVAALVLGEVVRRAGRARPVAMLNLADALHHIENPAAAYWYDRYVSEEPKPVDRALQRRTPITYRSGEDLFPWSGWTASREQVGSAKKRFFEALERNDLALAYGAAASGRFEPWNVSAWWEAGARDLSARLDRGAHFEVDRVLGLLGRPPKALRAELTDTLLPVYERWVRGPGRPPNWGHWFDQPRTSQEAALFGQAHWLSENVPGQALTGIGKHDGNVCFLSNRRWWCGGNGPARSDLKPKRAQGMVKNAWSGWQSGNWPSPEQRCTLLTGRVHCDAPLHDEPRGHDFRALTNGRGHSCALHETRRLECWGDNGRGQAPASVDGVVGVIADADWTCIVDERNQPRCFGDAPALPTLPELATTYPSDALWQFHRTLK
ncbi:MAG: RCC1 domain-containing protein [Myxococcota bacterium]